MVEIERCWCDRWPRRCQARVTQEDMRCNICRDGCALLAAGTWAEHVGQGDVTIWRSPEATVPAVLRRYR
jgi:hypothetical protein